LSTGVFIFAEISGGLVHLTGHIFLFRRNFGFCGFAFWKRVLVFAKQIWGFVLAFVGKVAVRLPFASKTSKTIRQVAFLGEYGGIQKTRF
jgi:hypothetical protein